MSYRVVCDIERDRRGRGRIAGAIEIDHDLHQAVRGHLRRLVRRIRRHWPATRITIRGDGHYSRPEAMEWCEANSDRNGERDRGGSPG